MNCDVWTSYDEFNAFLRREGCTDIANYSEFNAPKNIALIIGVRKWTWDGMGDHPEWPERLGYTYARHDPMSAKYDVFFYTR